MPARAFSWHMCAIPAITDVHGYWISASSQAIGHELQACFFRSPRTFLSCVIFCVELRWWPFQPPELQKVAGDFKVLLTLLFCFWSLRPGLCLVL